MASPKLYLELTDSPELFLKSNSTATEDPILILKANPFRDPVLGSYIAGGAHKAQVDGQEDLTEALTALFDEMPDGKLKKE